MSPLEYVETVAVDAARYRAKETVYAVRTNVYGDRLRDTYDWRRYIWALGDELDREGLNGVRL